MPYWNSVEEEAALFNVITDDKSLNEKILKKIVQEKRKKQEQADEIRLLSN
jgi:hypothetical protein